MNFRLCFFILSLFFAPSRPCCSEIHQGNSCENFVGNPLPSAEVQKLRSLHYHSSLAILLRLFFPPQLRSFSVHIDAFTFHWHTHRRVLPHRACIAQTAAVAAGCRDIVTFIGFFFIVVIFHCTILPSQHHTLTVVYVYIVFGAWECVSVYDFLYIVLCTQVMRD